MGVQRTRAATVFAGIAVIGLVATGCGSKSTTTNATSPGGTSTGSAFSACMVLDTGGIDDHSFNQGSYAGMTAAHAANSNISISYVPSNSQNDYTPNLTAQVNKKCGAIVAVGGLMSDAVKAVAAKNPSDHFAEVDAPSSGPNVYGIQYNTAQGAFLGGYLAAGMTKSGVVATYGGLNIPPVTIYMDGFWEGVQYYNQQKGTTVKVLGWDETNQKGGTFAGGFTDQGKGKSITETFEQQGADIVFPVAGGVGLGSGAAAAASGGKLNLLWVDTDGCESVPQYCQYFISSVTKNLSAGVQQYVSAAATGSFPTGSYVGTLANKGTGLADFHDFASKVPSALQSELTQVSTDIQSGKITIKSPSQPAS